MNRWRSGEAAQRSAERRRRENEAPRLAAVVPRLESLKLELEEHRGGHTLADGRHIRRIVVAHAPALFELPCQDSSCEGGGHDLTAAILRALRAAEPRFEGEDPCRGTIGSANAECGRVLRYVGTAEYRS